MKRFILLCLVLVCWLPARAATNVSAADLQLGDKRAIELTAGLKQYENPSKVPGKLTSIGGGVPTILINRWAAEFATLHPEAELNIQSGGSVDGMEKLIAGQADLVPMSRPLSAEEIARFKAKFHYEPAQIVVAQDAVGIYVNKNNPLAGLTLAQLEAIYSRQPGGGVKTPEFWSDLGVAGPLAQERIVRVSLSRVYGTYQFLQEEVLHGAEYRFDVRFEVVPSSLVQAAGAEPAAIGCASVMFGTRRTRLVPLQATDRTWVLPTYENIANGHYPLVRPMRVAFHRKPDGSMNPVAREFLDFAVSRRGQRIIALADSYPLTVEQQQAALRVLGEVSGR